MPSTYSTNLRLELIASGEQANTWGNTTNTNLGTLIETAISGYVSLTTMTDADYTLIALNGANDQARQMYLNVPNSANLTATRAIIAPSVPKVYVISNNSSGGQAVRIKTSGSTTTCLIPNGQTKTVVCDGTNFSEAVTAADVLTLGANPTSALQATTKQYVDAADATKLNLSGGTMTGALNLIASTPTGNNATSFNYVNTNYVQKTGSGTQTIDQYLSLNYTPTLASHAIPKSYADSNFVGLNNVQTIAGTKTFSTNVSLSGSAQLILPNAPLTGTQATNKDYVDGVAASGQTYVDTYFALKSTRVIAGSGIAINGVSEGTLGSNLIISVVGGGTVTSVSATSPLVASGTAAVTLSIPPATTSAAGYLSSTDWNTFYNKMDNSSAAITAALGYIPYNGTANPNGYITSSALTPYLTISSASSTYYPLSNPSSYITSSALTPYLTISSASTTYVAKTGSTMTGALNIQNASSPSTYITVNTIYESGNYYPAISSKNTSSTAYADIVMAQENSVGSRLLPLICGPNGNVNIGYLLKMTQLVSGGTTGASIDNDGTLIRTPSDASLKENVEELSGGLLQVLALNPVYYDWIDKQRFGEGRQIGFIAQEVQPIVPEAISHNADDTLSLDYPKLVATLTSAIQELNAKVEALTTEVNALKGV